jgi:chemotaxis signal transduction protein
VSGSTAGRLLTFEIAGALFARPISDVLEVAEPSGEACIPSVPAEVACVMNYRGDALPVVRRERILAVDGTLAARPENLLVISDRATAAPRLGLEVDRVIGLEDSPPVRSRDGSVVAERRPMSGRVACILDPVRVVARAREVIEGTLAQASE